MKYVSTRGEDNKLKFEEVMLNGLARDGGLYLPERFPVFSLDKIQSFIGKSYYEIAVEVFLPFVGTELNKEELYFLAENSYSNFSNDKIAPLKRLNDNLHVLELFHGPTLAFKDYAMQFLSQILKRSLRKKNKRIVILGATSGDTGSAALQAFRGNELIDIFILFPKNRVSHVQQKQMTTISENGAHAIAVDGNFDDCQFLVKSCFKDSDFREKVSLTSINSINWARLMPQIVYYFTSALELDVFSNKIIFSVPTGNFGNVFSAWVAKKMGLPIEKLIIASNQNDIINRFFTSGKMEKKKVIHSLSPSMDIEVSSNFERFLFHLFKNDPKMLKKTIENFEKNGNLEISKNKLNATKNSFVSFNVSDSETIDEISDIYKEFKYLIDPHTAVGLAAAKKFYKKNISTENMKVISLACAHPSKFPDAVEKATKVNPRLPSSLSNLLKLKENIYELPNNLYELKQFILKKMR